MFKSLMRSMLFAALLSSLPFLASAAGLDNYYLSQFDAHYGRHLQPAGVVAVQSEAQPERCLTPLYHGLKRDWKQLAPETQKVLAKYLAKPVLSDPNPAVFTLPGGHFAIHYAKLGTDAPPPLDLNQNQIPDWVETVAATFENVYSVETGPSQFGYTAAPTLAGAPYDVYLKNLAPGGTVVEFGETVTDVPVSAGSTSFTSFITIDNDFSAAKFGNQITNYTPDKALQITAAHEYHHAIQYGYNFFFDIWYAEATSTWMEDEVYDGVNQLYNYLSNYMTNTGASLDIPPNVSTGGGYGRWIFNRYLSEKYDMLLVRSIWEKLRLTNPPRDSQGNPFDIPMVPVIDDVLKTNTSSLADDFLSFCKKLYVRNWTSHLNEVILIHPVVPIATITSFPANGTPLPVPNVSLPSLSFAYYRYDPLAVGAPQDLVLQAANLPAGVVAVAFRKDATGITEYGMTLGGSTITVPRFNAPTTVEVFLLLCNKSFSAVTVASSSSTSSGGGGGCFIATAAYGSYLHPKVMLLREFRDKYLLTNAPGRAFVALYYRLSPPLADFIARHDSLRIASRILLTPVVLAVEYKGLATVLLLIGVFGMAGGYLRSRSFM